MKTLNSIAIATMLALGIGTGVQAAPASGPATPRPHRPLVVSHPATTPVRTMARPVAPMPAHPMPAHVAPLTRTVEPRRVEERTEPRPVTRDLERPATVKRTTEHPTTPTRNDERETRSRQLRERDAWHDMSQPVTVFEGRTRVSASAVALSNSHVIVRMPNGTLRTFVALREGRDDRDSIAVNEKGRVRTLRILDVTRPVAHRIVVFTSAQTTIVQPEMTALQAFAPASDQVMLVQPNDVLQPFAVTGIQPLPFGQVALFGNDMIGPTFAPADVTFEGQVIGVAGDMVTFLLPDGSTRTLADMGMLPAIGSQVVVTENGQEVVGVAPAVTNFTGQVIGAESPFVTFALPNGTVRTLTTVQPVPPLGTQTMVFENGPRVQRIVTL